MRFLIQRVSRASVSVEDTNIGSIETGLLVLIGIAPHDTIQIGLKMIEKSVNLRIFEDDEGKMNRSILDLLAAGNDRVGVLAVSQFTLYADCRKGRRPSFIGAAPPEMASNLMDQLVEGFATTGLRVGTGSFGAHMLVSLENDGPVTIMLDSDELFPAGI